MDRQLSKRCAFYQITIAVQYLRQLHNWRTFTLTQCNNVFDTKTFGQICKSLFQKVISKELAAKILIYFSELQDQHNRELH